MLFRLFWYFVYALLVGVLLFGIIAVATTWR